MENEMKNFDDLFREQFADYAETPPPAVWPGIEKRLDNDKKRRAFPFRWYWFISIISFLTLLGAAVLWNMGISHEPAILAHVATNSNKVHPAPSPISEPENPNNSASIETKQQNQPTTTTTKSNSNTHKTHKTRSVRHNKTAKNTNHSNHTKQHKNNDQITTSANAPATGTSIYSYDDFEEEVAVNKNTTPVATASASNGYKMHKTRKNKMIVVEMKPASTPSSADEADENEQALADNGKTQTRHNNSQAEGSSETSATSDPMREYAAAKSATSEETSTAFSSEESETTQHTSAATKITSAKKASQAVSGNDIAKTLKAKSTDVASTTPMPSASAHKTAETKQETPLANTTQPIAKTSAGTARVGSNANSKSTTATVTTAATSALPKTTDGATSAKKPLDLATETKNTSGNGASLTASAKTEGTAGIANTGSKTATTSVAATENNKAEMQPVSAQTPSPAAQHNIPSTSTNATTISGVASSGTHIEAIIPAMPREKQLTNSAAAAGLADLPVAATTAPGKKSESNSTATATKSQEANSTAAATDKSEPQTTAPSIAGTDPGAATQTVNESAGAETGPKQKNGPTVPPPAGSTGTAAKPASTSQGQQPLVMLGKDLPTSVSKSTAPPASTPLIASTNPAAVSKTVAEEETALAKPEVNPGSAPKAPKAANKTTAVPPPVDSVVTETSDTAIADAPRMPSRFIFGVKGGYETALRDKAANKAVFSPFVEFRLNNRLSLLVQPSIKGSNIRKRSIGGAESYYDINKSSGRYEFQDSVLTFLPFTLDTLWRRNYNYTETHDSIVKTYSTGGTYVEVELPLLLKYSLTPKLSVYGGVNTVFGRMAGVKENTSVTKDIALTGQVITLAPLNAPAPQPTGTGLAYSGNPFSKYSGPTYPATQQNMLRMGYMLGVSYEFKKRWLADVLLQQCFVKKNIQSGYDVNAPLSMPYLRVSIGYRISK
jgi:hypothetical protein